jgi:hypothetical protein
MPIPRVATVDYLNARAKLPLEMRRTIGREKDLYAFYLLNNETFDGCRSFADVEAVLLPNSDDLERRIAEKLRKDRFAEEIEFVSDCLAVRAPDYAVGLDAATLALFDPPDGRTNYTTIQEHLCDLRLPERRMMGKMLHDLRQQAAENKKGHEGVSRFSRKGRTFFTCSPWQRGSAEPRS